MRQDWPSVSVVIPTFGRQEALHACLRALAGLDYPRERLEIVVVDDGSPMPVEPPRDEHCRELAVRVIRQGNRGPACARNLGAERASGQILAFTDDDCAPRAGWLKTLVAALDAEPRALVGGITRNALGENLFAEASQELVGFLYGYFPEADALLPFFTSNNIAMSRELFRGLGGFDESFRFSAAEDRDLSERWAAQVGPLRFVPEAVLDHRHHMGPGRFLRQHHLYGRGAVHLARRRQSRGQPIPRPEPISFYIRMLRHPFKRHGRMRGLALAALVAVAQLANLTGIAREILRPSVPVPGGDRLSA